MLPGMLSRLMQAQLALHNLLYKLSKQGHHIPILRALGTPVGSRRCRKAPEMPPGTSSDVQEISEGDQKMKLGDATTSLAPSSFS